MSRISVLFFVVCCTTAYAQKGLKESIGFEKPPVIDGKMEDWPSEWWLDPDGKFISNVGNDAENLYVRLKIADDITQQKIGWFGLSVKLNPSGKRKGKVGLKYPVGKDATEIKKEKPEAVSASDNRNAMVEMKKDLISDVEVVELIGLAKKNIVSSRLGLANGIEAIIVAQEDGSYIYEAKIPFKAFRINKKEVEVLGVEFETGKYSPPSKSTSTSSQTDPTYRAAYRSGMAPRPYLMASSGYQYNAFSSPGYLFLPVKLK
ncbi:MAG: hypothetical protein JST48_03750 [Bacteroidetes bacterium]|nr:hypothetical protein [Bacteroidota bacterium]